MFERESGTSAIHLCRSAAQMKVKGERAAALRSTIDARGLETVRRQLIMDGGAIMTWCAKRRAGTGFTFHLHQGVVDVCD
jgi:hypothetical protein